MKQMAAEAAYVSVKHIHVYRFPLFLFSGSMTTDRNAFDSNIDFLNGKTNPGCQWRKIKIQLSMLERPQSCSQAESQLSRFCPPPYLIFSSL